MTEGRYFWDNTKAGWTPGAPYPNCHCYAAPKVGWWHPQSGYRFKPDSSFETYWLPNSRNEEFKNVSADSTEGRWKPDVGYRFAKDTTGSHFETDWEPGQKYPGLMVMASKTEGNFTLYPGYHWNSEQINDLSVHWVAGLKYPDLKIISDTAENSYSAYPGYKFTQPEKGLDVAWIPGMINPDYPSYVSGQLEGTWDPVAPSNPPTTKSDDPADHFIASGFEWLIAKFGEWILGKDNRFSNGVYHESTVEGVKGVVSLFKEH